MLVTGITAATIIYTAFTETVLAFDTFFAQNYEHLLSKVHYLFKGTGIGEDQKQEVLHNVYANSKQQIQIKGFIGTTGLTGTGFMSYVFTGMRNELRTYANKRRKNKEVLIPIDHDNEPLTDFLAIQQHRFDPNEDERQTVLNEKKANFLGDRVLIFVSLHFSKDDYELFQKYYDSKGVRQTYQKLTKLTGYNFSTIERIIRDIKRKIRKDFPKWVETDYSKWKEKHL